MQKIVITGVAGFIGFHLAKRLLQEQNLTIIGIDNLNNYYSVKLKKDRLKILKKFKKRFVFKKIDICDQKKINSLFSKNKINKVVHLAAQAGVRYVKKNPSTYFQNNLKGFFNVLETCRLYKVKHLISASTSSVYGLNKKMPFNVDLPADHPTQFYAASKRSNELMAHSYSHMFNLPITLIRFFTAYGPWGRPDMAAMIFIKKIINDEKIDVYNFGNMKRDFTYIDDIVNGTINALNLFENRISKKLDFFNIFNLGNSKSINLLNFIKIIEDNLQKKANINFLPMQLGDVKKTFADIKKSKEYLDYQPLTNIKIGIRELVKWYKNYY